MSNAIVHILDHASRRNGGIFESVLGYTHGLSELADWRVCVAANDDAGVPEDRRRWGEIPLILYTPKKMDFRAHGLARLVAETRPEIVHIHGIWGMAARAGLHLARGTPSLGVVVSPHGMLDAWALRHNRWKKQIGWRAWAQSLLSRADILHALNEPERNTIERVIGRRSIVTIANGVDLPDDGISNCNSSGDRKLLFLGRIHPKKGLPALLDAWAHAGAAVSGWRLIIAGWDDGGHEVELKAQRHRLGLDDRIDFAGAVFGRAKDEMLRSASGFILPSRSEGLPMAVLEAWSYRLPVLMTEECNLEEGFVAGAALRIRTDFDSIASALRAFVAMTAEVREAMGSRGRALVEARFSWPNVARELAAAYECVLSQRARTGVTRVPEVSAVKR